MIIYMLVEFCGASHIVHLIVKEQEQEMSDIKLLLVV